MSTPHQPTSGGEDAPRPTGPTPRQDPQKGYWDGHAPPADDAEDTPVEDESQG